MTDVIADEKFRLSLLGKIWLADHSWSLTAGAQLDFSFVIGQRDVIALSRNYFTLSTSITVELYEASFTGGIQMHTINRRLASSGDPKPTQFYYGVTPGALGSKITGFVSEATSSNRVGKDGEKEPFVHTAQATYVLRVINSGSGNQPFTLSVEYREKIPYEY
ncbi:hypothetical protein [Pseudomonas sp. NUPR-001]|uniref:hypothetical protein n=1 Tax=Pseudomonas sp. NUPR-001 TaxID=3416058 RepID=UPI003F9544D4